jgi:amidophosphoribosyltransferase
MSRMKDFIVFRAMVALLKEHGKDHLLDEVYEKCLSAVKNKTPQNFVLELYNQFSEEEISNKVSEIVKPSDMKAEVQVVFQTVDNLHKACPNHIGDWYFTGHYPTTGGMRVVNQAYVNYMDGKLIRAY